MNGGAGGPVATDISAADAEGAFFRGRSLAAFGDPFGQLVVVGISYAAWRKASSTMPKNSNMAASWLESAPKRYSPNLPQVTAPPCRPCAPCPPRRRRCGGRGCAVVGRLGPSPERPPSRQFNGGEDCFDVRAIWGVLGDAFDEQPLV